jgi:hypothetical protein
VPAEEAETVEKKPQDEDEKTIRGETSDKAMPGQ